MGIKDVTSNRVDDLARQVARDPELQDALKQDPVGAMQTIASQPAYIDDRFIYRSVVLTLGGVVLVTAIGAITLAALTLTVPDALVALGSAVRPQ